MKKLLELETKYGFLEILLYIYTLVVIFDSDVMNSVGRGYAFQTSVVILVIMPMCFIERFKIKLWIKMVFSIIFAIPCITVILHKLMIISIPFLPVVTSSKW